MQDAPERMNDARTCTETDTPLTHGSSANVLRDLLVRRNLAEQSKWLNDPDPRPWATHPMQTVAGMMQWQRDCLTKGK